MAKKHKKWGRVKSHTRRVAGVFELASKDKGFKAAKKAKAKAEARSKAAWKKAVSKAKKKVRSRK